MSHERRSLKSIRVLYEDECFVVFDKPPGLLVIPSPKKEVRTLINIVNETGVGSESGKLHPCHRLDRDTSGAIIFAKGKRNQQRMMDAFKKGDVKKKYIAFVHGRLKRKNGEIKSPVRDLDEAKYRKRAHPKWALTRYKVLRAKKNYSILEVEPVTGRTNQIRIHFKQIGHPLVGERKYAFAKDYALKFRRTALHAKELQWRHPLHRKTVKVVSPLARDMATFS